MKWRQQNHFVTHLLCSSCCFAVEQILLLSMPSSQIIFSPGECYLCLQSYKQLLLLASHRHKWPICHPLLYVAVQLWQASSDAG